MPILSKAKPLGLIDDDEDDDDVLEEPRRFLQLPCGTLLAYGGDDGHIAARRLPGNKGSEEDFRLAQRYDDGVRAVAISDDGKRVAAGFDDGSTLIYKYEDYDGNSELHPFVEALRAKKNSQDDDLLSQDIFNSSDKSFAGPHFHSSPIRDMYFPNTTEGEYWLAVASESGLCIVNVTSSDTLTESRQLEREVQQHHDNCGIRGIALSKNYMASLAMDGRLCLWDMASKSLLKREETTCISKRDVGEVHGADAFDRSCRPLFTQVTDKTTQEPVDWLITPGKLLPNVRRLVHDEGSTDVSLETVEIINTQPDEGHVDTIVCVAFLDPPTPKADNNNRYFLTSGRDSRLILWKLEGDARVTPLEVFSLPCPATDLHQHSAIVYAACSKGTYAIVDLAPHVPGWRAALESNDKQGSKSSTNQETDSPSTHTRSIPDGNDSDNSSVEFGPNDESGDKDKTQSSPTSQGNRVRFIVDEADDDGDDDAITGTLPPTDTGYDDLDDFRQDRTADALDAAMDDLDVEQPRFQSISASLPPRTPPQPPFSPSSTPLDLARRFMCWNHIGAVTLLQGDDRNTVDISFTDSAYKRPISFTDNMSFILASLGEDGGIFASDLQTEDPTEEDIDDLDDLNMSESTKQAVRKSSNSQKNKPTGSAIFFYRFETFGNLREKDWYLTLPDGERVLGAAAGAGWAAVATSRQFLRFFTSGGNQSKMIWLNGDPVTMVGRGRFMAVIYHQGEPLEDGTQMLGYTLWDATSLEVLSQGPLSCLSKRSTLTWVGFNNDYSLMAMDSDGMMSMLIPAGSDGSRHGEWVPILDTVGLRKSADDLFWPVTVFDGKLVCVPLKGGNTYPDAARRPVTSTLGLRLPLAASSSVPKVSMLEELSVRSNLALTQKRTVAELEGDNVEDLEQELVGLSAQVDKVTLKLFAAMVDANKLERALDLVDRLHLEKSHDLAVQIADRHYKLADLIEEAKERKFAAAFDQEEEDQAGEGETADETTDYEDRLASSRQISPDSSHTVKRVRIGDGENASVLKKQRLALIR